MAGKKSKSAATEGASTDDSREINSESNSDNSEIKTGASVNTDAIVVINRTLEKLCETFNKTLNTMMGLIESKINIKVESQGVEIFDLNARVERLEKTNTALQKENDELRKTVKSLTTKNDEMKASFDGIEQSQRRNNVIIHGVPVEPKTVSLETKVVEIINSKLGLSVKEHDVADVHRMPKTTPKTNQTDNKPPAILLELRSRKIRNEIMEKRKLLKGLPIAISEHLAPARSQLLMKANAMVTDKKLQSAWSTDGKILVKPNQSTRVIQIKNFLELEKFEEIDSGRN